MALFYAQEAYYEDDRVLRMAGIKEFLSFMGRSRGKIVRKNFRRENDVGRAQEEMSVRSRNEE